MFNNPMAIAQPGESINQLQPRRYAEMQDLKQRIAAGGQPTAADQTLLNDFSYKIDNGQVVPKNFWDNYKTPLIAAPLMATGFGALAGAGPSFGGGSSSGGGAGPSVGQEVGNVSNTIGGLSGAGGGILDALKNPKTLAALGLLATKMLHGNGSSLSDLQSQMGSNPMLALQQQQALRQDPLHQAVTQLATNLLPNSAFGAGPGRPLIK